MEREIRWSLLGDFGGRRLLHYGSDNVFQNTHNIGTNSLPPDSFSNFTNKIGLSDLEEACWKIYYSLQICSYIKTPSNTVYES